MPELPEVETVRRGLASAIVGARFVAVDCRRPDLRFPLPARFAERLRGARIEGLGRRGKYMIATLSSGESLILHLGMSGRFTIEGARRGEPGGFYFAEPPDPRHDHVVFELLSGAVRVQVTYNDPRRFGFMDLTDTARLEQSAHFLGMGPEPLGPEFTAAAFDAAIRRTAAPIKSALLDQRTVAGVGNIYACEALFRARVSPRRSAASVAGVRAERLRQAIREVLEEAIEAGGSSLRDFAGSDGASGRFQDRFKVYDREGEACPHCGTSIRRLVQGGRSTFFCGVCQR